MTDAASGPAHAIPAQPPSIPPRAPFAERRTRLRRAADRRLAEERRLLASALDVLASDRPAEERLAGLLDLVAHTVGAERAAVVSDGEHRRVAVSVSGDEDLGAATDLAAWLDASAPRSRARRAASVPADVVVARRDGGRTVGSPSADAQAHYAALPIAGAGEVTLGFAFRRTRETETVRDRLPPALARHVAVALALVTDAMSMERDLIALRAKDSERERFVSTVAHELRTPLTGLAGYLDLILDGQVDDDAIEREFLERGRSIVGSMAELVGDLLEVSRLESGSLVLEPAPFSVADAVASVTASLMPLALQRGVHLTASTPPRIQTAIGDRRRVEQILTNLVSNALKFGADGGEIEVDGRFDGPVAIIAVRDEGPGIGAEDRQRVFDRFYRMADHERTAGTGLGLSIARDLARSMDGDLGVASALGVGSAFVLLLPGPAGPVEPDLLAEAVSTALTEEADRLDALGAVRAAGRPTTLPRRDRTRSVALGTRG
jgi:signal transduction histidine kinase